MSNDDEARGGRSPSEGEIWRALQRIERAQEEARREYADGRRETVQQLEQAKRELLEQLDRAKREINIRIDGHEKKHEADARETRVRHEQMSKEIGTHFTEDAEQFARLESQVQTRTWLGGLGLAVSAALGALGIKPPTP